MQNVPVMWQRHGSNEQGEYCSRVFCSDLDRMNRDINYLLYFTLPLPLKGSKKSMRTRSVFTWKGSNSIVMLALL